MNNINDYIIEALLSRSNPKAISGKKDTNNMYDLEVGDILVGRYGYSVILPRFYKITKKRLNDFSLIRLKGKIVEGHKKGEWKEIATDEPWSDVELKGKITKEYVKIGDVKATYRDGKPVYGNDIIK